jgi:hypothetical protein
VWLWLAFVAFMMMRMATLLLRAHSDRWLVLGAVSEVRRVDRRPRPG